MNAFNETLHKTLAIIGGWKQRLEPTAIDLEICNGVAREDGNTCWRCVALNKTVFKENNMPKYKHPNCECFHVWYYLDKVNVIFDFSKIVNYLFKDENKK